jgi:hypothetical protein
LSGAQGKVGTSHGHCAMRDLLLVHSIVANCRRDGVAQCGMGS